MATTQPTLTMPAAPAPASASARSPLGSLLLGAGSILAAGLILGGGLTLLDIAARHTYDVRTSYAAVQSLSINGGAGDIHLTSGPAASRLTVTERVTEALTSPHRAAALGPGGRLRLDSGCGGFDLECRVAYTVAVPTGVPVDVQSGAGDVTAAGLHTAGAVRLSSSAGDVTASDISSSFLLLSSAAGNIVGTRLDSRQVGLSSGAGDISADLTGLVDRLVAGSHAGSITLRVPNSTYDLHTSAGSGTVSDQAIRTDPASPRAIAAISGAGDITVTPSG
jgi:hypothetical protein